MPADGSPNKGHHHGISRISVNRTLESIYILVDMHSHKTITIMTSPTAATKPLPGCTSPTSKGPVQYRIEERSRTVYVTSDLSPSQWEHSLDQIFSLAEEAETTQAPTHLTQTLSVDAQVLTSEDSTATGVADARAQSPRNINYRSRRSEFVPTATLGTYTDSPRRSSPRTIVRPRILFYHKHDPHYGFTNFSEHPVVYKGKRYPTSEHLFQSFKVSMSCGTSGSHSFFFVQSSRIIVLIWQNIFEHAQRDRVLLSRRLVAFNLKCDKTGSKSTSRR